MKEKSDAEEGEGYGSNVAYMEGDSIRRKMAGYSD